MLLLPIRFKKIVSKRSGAIVNHSLNNTISREFFQSDN